MIVVSIVAACILLIGFILWDERPKPWSPVGQRIVLVEGRRSSIVLDYSSSTRVAVMSEAWLEPPDGRAEYRLYSSGDIGTVEVSDCWVFDLEGEIDGE